MKKILLLTFTIAFAMTQLAAQKDCNCGSIKFLIGQWKCQGKNAAGNPVYSGVLNVGNGPDCTFKLQQIMQQVGGDVSLAMPLTVLPNTVVNVPITFTDNPPFIAAGTTAHFILVFTRGDKKCKIEIQSDKFPACTDTVCKCNPKSAWESFTANINGKQSIVKCGNQFSLTCADTITLKSAYKCIGNCEAKYVATLRNAVTGVTIQTYSPFTFPWSYHFTAAGNYTLEITPLCGHNKCTPCRFSFTVKCKDVVCDCNVNGWSNFTWIDVTGLKKETKCGGKIPVKKGQPIQLIGKYTCKGHCVAKYVAVLRNNTTGVVIQNYPSFNFPFNYTFAAAGAYRLEITPICGDKKCPPCDIYYSVD